mmetsp:Transcript_6303/g.15690  ORF Transcript_6303/g.15690 Transcript_6303/m.15690 type:complete len:342 (-) Transcript_6303:289-1314(-)
MLPRRPGKSPQARVHVVQPRGRVPGLAGEPHVLQRLRRRQPVLRVGIQQPPQQIPGPDRDIRPRLPCVKVQIARDDGVHQLVVVLVVKRPGACKQRVHSDPQRPHVHALPVHPSQQRLGCHVGQGPAHVLRPLARRERLGQAEIHQSDGAEVVGARQHQVLQLEISVHHPARVHEGYGVQHLGHDQLGVALRVHAHFGYGVHELLSSQQLHHHVHSALSGGLGLWWKGWLRSEVRVAGHVADCAAGCVVSCACAILVCLEEALCSDGGCGCGCRGRRGGGRVGGALREELLDGHDVGMARQLLHHDELVRHLLHRHRLKLPRFSVVLTIAVVLAIAIAIIG